MARNDLLMLSEDDLAALTNRGTVKRAQKELESGQLTMLLEEGPDDRVLFTWSDGTRCEFPAGKSIHDARCSSGALGITRHIIRSVLAYQQRHRASSSSDASVVREGLPSGTDVSKDPVLVRDATESLSEVSATSTGQTPPSASGPTPIVAATVADHVLDVWDPGQISDEALVSVFGSAAMTRARTRFEDGTLVELFRGKKPYAIFLDENCCVRFLVPGDARYVTSDCVESVLPRYVAMAVWAFRELPADKHHGLLSLQQKIQPAPVDLLGELEKVMLSLATQGISQLPPTFVARLARLETQLREQSLVWPAELVAELCQLVELYQQHDARFDPQAASQLVGELVARGRAIANDKGQVPQMLIRGSRAERPFDIEAGRYVGLGLAFRTNRHSTTLNAYLQATDTGIITTIERTFANATASATPLRPAAQAAPVKAFHELAETSLYRGISLARLAQSQVFLKTAKRTVSGELILPRSATGFSLNPQAFQWEQLKAPLLAENFAQVRDRIEIQPPSFLGPRRRTAGLYVVPLKRVGKAEFDIVTQKLVATLVDEDEAEATLELPFHTRGSAGFDHFMHQVNTAGENVKFIAGLVRVVQGQIRLVPSSFIVSQSTARTMILPYVMTPSHVNMSANEDGSATEETDIDELPHSPSPVDDFLSALADFSGELLLAGVGNRSSVVLQQTESMAERALETGFVRIGGTLRELAKEFETGRNSIDHSWDRAARLALGIALIDRIQA